MLYRVQKLSLNKEFLEIQTVWENNMITRFRELANLPVVTSFESLNIFAQPGVD